MSLYKVFVPDEPPSENQLQKSRRLVIGEGAVAAVIYAAGTGNFLAGYLTQLGASVSLCAIVAIIPQLGCVLQIASPYLFERLQYRKFAIWITCVAFRFMLGFVMVIPAFFPAGSGVLPVVVGLYLLAFLAAGFVTPGLQHMLLEIAPENHRGAFFASKDIVATGVNSVAILVLGRQLDYFTQKGQPITGYIVIGAICLALACVDAVMLGAVQERPAASVSIVRFKDLIAPLKNKDFRPVFQYLVIGGFMGGLASSFLSVYLLRVLGLSHTFITTVGVAAAVAGMVGSWLWGHLADRTTWDVIVKYTAALSFVCTIGWALVNPQIAKVVAPVLLCITSACGSGAAIASLNMQYASSPATGKTTYIAITSAVASVAAVLAATLSTSLQPLLENILGDYSISVLFLAAGIGGFVNLIINGRKLPAVK